MIRFRCVVVALGLSLLIGCSSRPAGGSTERNVDIIQEVNDLLHMSINASGRGPTKLSDMDRLRAMFPRGYQAVKSGDIVVVWGSALKGEGEVGKDETVSAYEKDVPTNGGHVLFSAGTVKTMTADEFKAAPKAGKK